MPILQQTRRNEPLKFQLRAQEQARKNVDDLENAWFEQLKLGKPSIYQALYKVYGVEYLSIAGYKLAWTVFTWAGAWYLLKMFLIFMGSNADVVDGHEIAIGLFLVSLFSSICIHQQYAECNRVGVKVRAAISGIVYRKSLRLSRVRGGAGEVINILSTDVTRINDAVVNFHFLWSAFVEVILILAIAGYEIQISALPALGWVLLLLPIQMYLGKRTNDFSRDQTQKTTERVHVMSEILTAIKLIKFYAWEAPFAEKIDGLRAQEMGLIYESMVNKAVNFTVVFAIPVLTALTSLGMYVALGNRLTASVSFTVLSVFNTLRYPFFMLPMAVKSYVGALTSFSRLDNFLQQDEVTLLEPSTPPAGSDRAFEIKDSDFKWDGAEAQAPTLHNISLSVKKGHKVAIVGDVGCGKSSILAALLGQIRQIRGDKVKVYGTTAYMSQEAWLLNLTLRDNIVFGKEYDAKKYKEVIRVCSLQRDLTLLLSGDRTEIAERGANLSGGQRQRVSLARSVYYDADIVLMDDPLSAVDQHVGRHIFEECFMKHLKDKTIVVCINQLQYLSDFDHIVFVRDGTIRSQGTFDELMANDADFQFIVSSHTVRSMIEKQAATTIQGAERDHDVAKVMARNEQSVYSISEIKKKEQEEEDDAEAIRKGKLVVDDESAKATGFGDFVAYARSGSGTAITLSVVFSFIFVHCIRLGGDFWLRLWVPRVGGYSDGVYIGVYGAFTFAFAIGVFLRGWFFSGVSTYKAVTLHDKLFDATIHAPMSFFDTTPVARILAAFSKHHLHVDDTMPDAAMQALQYFPLGLGALIMCAVLIPWNWASAIGVVLMGYALIKWSTPADYATKGLEATSKPPIYSHLTATLEGLFSIRAYHAQKRFDSMNLERLDTNHENLFAMQSVKSFQALYLDIFSSLYIYLSALLLIFARGQPDIASITGLALSNALQMLVFVQWTVRQWGEVETQMSSVGQLVYYGKTAPEAPFEIPEKKPPATWPTEGRIKFKNIVLKYQKNGVAVLKDINLVIHPREKIGIVGRTGSGKSTLLVSLLRIVESCEGLITIDDLDVSKIGLHDLRKKIAIIPQEPVMFVGTFRSNLDPFFRCTDEEIWKALDAVHLGEKIRKLPNKLDTAVAENGRSVSQGQRQLLCIARAILSKAKVLVLDEATASLDAQTDALIQETIKKNFADLTMLTIAHRLNTIIESDRVLVMDAGRVLEFDEPYELLKNPEGSFRALVDQTGEGAAQRLMEVATAAHEKRVQSGYHFPQRQDVQEQPLTMQEIAAGKV
ncbi:P-loop containing nucleoside triphosphate hydrolase protein [Gorgonomyces haynaldii]|nr:P-loop containing nucleoside triphosphate hydrolase protein [Gorgonomyces haynaldii]